MVLLVSIISKTFGICIIKKRIMDYIQSGICLPLDTAMALVIASEGTVTSFILLHICQFKSNLESLFFKWTSYI